MKERILFILLETWEFSACAKWNTFPHGSIYFIHNYRLRIISGVCAGSWNLSKISLYHYLVIYGIMLWWSYDTNTKRNTWHDTGIWERKFSNSSHKKIYFYWVRGEALERRYLRERRKLKKNEITLSKNNRNYKFKYKLIILMVKCRQFMN